MLTCTRPQDSRSAESRYADIGTASPTMDDFHFVGTPDFAIPKYMDFLSLGFPISRRMTFLSGIFPNAPIATTRPPKMDDPDRFLRFQSFHC
jgi:hypothetical protein